MAYETMTIERKDGVATLWFDRPQARNAVSMQFCLDLAEAVDELAADDLARVIVLRGRGPVFCAGADLRERDGWDDRMLRRRRVVGKEAFQKLANLQKPVIAIVQGAAVGAGAELALIADFSYAVKGARFRWPEVVWGSLGATQRLSRRVGRSVAKELLFTGAFIDADEALRLGVVNRVLAEEDVEQVVTDTAASIAARPPVTLRETKRAVDVGTELPLTVGLEVERAALEISLASEEWKQGIEDFKQR